MSHNTVYVLCFWRRYIPIWFPLALQVQFILSLHWRPPYCLTVIAVQDRIPLSTVPVPTLLQSSLGATAWRDFGEGSWMLPPSFGLGPGKWNLEASFPPSVQWFAQIDIPKFYNWLSLDGFFPRPMLKWLLNLCCEVAEFCFKGWSTSFSIKQHENVQWDNIPWTNFILEMDDLQHQKLKQEHEAGSWLKENFSLKKPKLRSLNWKV